MRPCHGRQSPLPACNPADCRITPSPPPPTLPHAAGMSLSPDGAFLLTNAMDNTLRAWDVRPYAPADR